MNIFDELHSRLSSKTRIRQLFKDVGTGDLEKILKRLKDVHEEKLKVKRAEEELSQQKQTHIAAIQKEMEALGLKFSDISQLNEGSAKIGRKRRNVSKHTFEYQSASGDTVLWYGSTTGRLPSEFQKYLEKTGKKRTDCIVESE